MACCSVAYVCQHRQLGSKHLVADTMTQFVAFVHTPSTWHCCLQFVTIVSYCNAITTCTGVNQCCLAVKHIKDKTKCEAMIPYKVKDGKLIRTFFRPCLLTGSYKLNGRKFCGNHNKSDHFWNILTCPACHLIPIPIAPIEAAGQQVSLPFQHVSGYIHSVEDIIPWHSKINVKGPCWANVLSLSSCCLVPKHPEFGEWGWEAQFLTSNGCIKILNIHL